MVHDEHMSLTMVAQVHYSPQAACPGSIPGQSHHSCTGRNVSPPASAALREGGAFYEHPSLGWTYRAHEGKFESVIRDG